MYERRAAGVSMKQVALDLEVRPEQLREWARQLGGRPGVGRWKRPSKSNSRWISTETDSITTSMQRVSHTAGGTWSARGTVLSLTDTTTAGAARTFIATITDRAIEFPEVPSRFERQ